MKKGISLMVSTILLVSLAIVLGLVVIGWSGGLVKKSVSRSGTRVGTELECSDVKLKLEEAPDDKIILKNNGKRDLEGYIVRIITDDGVSVDDSNKDNKISAYGATTYNYGIGSWAEEQGVDVVDINKIEVISKINIDEEGREIVDCTNKIVGYCIKLEKC